ncbi:hypothetical protein L3Q82_011026 [Scortum barcoo]|uniref:Uncharacterized protein n=1 Tax=Scortum barcoo TaxID=214431 RepID=A0ACB8WBP8_9TELE|nr:hypothetical protein L3Q82_011026 [Scortum barcoo]
MAHVQTPPDQVGTAPVRVRKRKNSNAQGAKQVYCILCRRLYLKCEAQEHMHGMLHHRELETVLGNCLCLCSSINRDSFHGCQACKASSMGLKEYAQHISTAQHKANLKSLISKNVKPTPLFKTLSTETVGLILDRNKKLKKEEKKAMKKKKKKLKQAAGQKQVKTLHRATRKHMVVSQVVKLEKCEQRNNSNNSVVQNKENKASILQRPPHQIDSAPQSQSRRLYRQPAGQGWHHPDVREQFIEPAQQLTSDNKFSVNHSRKVKIENSQTDRPVRRPDNTQGGQTSQHDNYNSHYDRDFTSDNLPHNGAIIFDHSQNDSMGSSQPEQEGSRCAAQPAAADRSANAAPIRDVDVSAMLWQIRRALGVREPCRADREARRQNVEAGVRSKEGGPHFTSAATTPVQSSQLNRSPPASNSDFCPSGVAAAKSKQTVKMTQGVTQLCEKTSAVASDSNGQSDRRERESECAPASQSPLSTSLDRTASSEPNLNVARRVRITNEEDRVQGEKEAKPTLNKLLSLSGARSKLSWREMHKDIKKRKQDRVKGMPRFGIELASLQPDQESSTQAEDLPLSEGFHWESVPASPSHWAGHRPPGQGRAHNPSHTETQSGPQMQEPLEQPAAAQEGGRGQTVEAVSVKAEPNFEDNNFRDNSNAKKRKQEVVTELSGKKKKTKSNKVLCFSLCFLSHIDQGQMDQLLAVSLREEELSHSLQDLDKSLVQARNALQAAYAEFQRLLLLRQQCTAEVNSLRAKRIEILQGMQGGFSGASNVAEKATTSSVGPAAASTASVLLSPLPSSSAFSIPSSRQSPPTNSASTLSQLHVSPLTLPNMPVKSEICQPPTVPSNPDTPQVPVNPPVHLFPSDLLPSLLLTQPGLAASTTAVTSVKQIRAECSTSVSTPPGSSVSVGLKDCVETVRLATEEAQPSDSDSEEEMGGNLCSEPAAKNPTYIFVSETDQNASAAAPDDNTGSESDNSVEMMEPSNVVVIDIDESDNDEAFSNVPVRQESPQRSVSVEFSSAGTQTSQNNDVERKVQPALASVPSETIDDEEPSLGDFLNHTGPVHGLQVHGGMLYTCSGDNTARAYSLKTKECQAVFDGHTNKINCLLVWSLPNMLARLYTGSSDQTIRCYSTKSKKCLEQISLPDRVLCLHVAWNILFAGLANGSVASYDLKTLKQLDVFECHGPRGVSCLGTAQEGARRVLLVGSYDSTISVRDAKSGLLLRTLEGHTKTVLCMKVVNDLVFSGSSDTSVHAHNIHTGELVRIYKGHGHAVTSIVILGKVMVTACLDKLVRVYELQSHDRLQVYGGHSDMVMCMAVHKSVIYTGSYDGSVQAVKLNLIKNYRCWWQNCSLIFGVAEHLAQHLVGDHTNPSEHMVKCRWRGCSTFFATHQSVRQELPEHMRSHVENDSKVQP